MSENNVQSVLVIGGGLVGSLCATFMAKRGYLVTLYEYRNDMRQTKLAKGRSINLALSNRGRRALSCVGLEDLVLKNAIPMKGRLLHDEKGETKAVPYDINSNQCIYSVGRNYLNTVLLTAAESHPNVKTIFNHKLISCNFEQESVTFLNTETEETVTASADLIIGADGAFSTLRRCMQQTSRFEFSQTYIQHGYVELSVTPHLGHLLRPNHLHIWPRGQFMMIALPNQDGSWTVTLFMPFVQFEALNAQALLVEQFFESTFPDAVALLGGAAKLVRDFLRLKPSPLVSIKCSPYYVGAKFLIVGDAAHAIVPFYGQGMNAGFEDCSILDEILAKNRNNIAGAIVEFSEKRRDDAFAISDLAMYNYVEMRDLVMRRSYTLRKMVDDFLYKWFPGTWIPLYNSVTFTAIGYRRCVQNRAWQDKVIQTCLWSLAAALISLPISYLAFEYFKDRQ